MTKNTKIILAAVVILVLGYLWYDNSRPVTTPEDNQQTGTTTRPAVIDVTQNGTTTSDYKLEVLPTANYPMPVPALYPPVVGTKDMSVEAVARLTTAINTAQASLKANPAQANVWIGLGTNRKMLGDYVGAKEAWVYAGKLAPTNFVSFANLADLEANFLNNTAAAKLAYATAIKNGPSVIGVYISAYQFYRFKMGDDTTAKAILSQGVKANPGTSADLRYLLDNYDKAK